MTAQILQDVSRAALRLAASYPDDDLGNPPDPLDDLIYIILSGQTSEALYQNTFRALKVAFPGWRGLAKAKISTIARIIEGGGLARQKAEYIRGIMRRVEADWGRPTLYLLKGMADEEVQSYLTSLPGVGVKTARCVMMYALGREVFPADVNCLRVMDRLGWIEWGGRRAELLAGAAQTLVPPHLRRSLHVDLVQHGRTACRPSAPLCDGCCLLDLCEHGGQRRKSRPTVVDLCCGAGGFAWGFMQAGYDVLLGVDTCRHALQTFATNIPGAGTMNLDITREGTAEAIRGRLGVRPPRVVIAGPPCQGFSRAGLRNPDDPRNGVLSAAVKMAVELGPDVILVENVLYLRGPSFVRYLNGAMGVVRRAGYRYEYSVLDSPSFGVPQARQRVVLIAARASAREQLLRVHDTLEGRRLVGGMSVAAVLSDLVKPSAGKRVYNHDPMSHGKMVVAKIRRIRPGEGPLSYRKLHPNQLAPTLVCGHRALPCHYALPRTITVREAARLQGFPDEYVFCGPRGQQMLQVANAVPPRLAMGVALAVAELIGFAAPENSKSLLENMLGRVSIRPQVGPTA
jgi:DNA (cytosine-5)-methyltransferase 1